MSRALAELPVPTGPAVTGILDSLSDALAGKTSLLPTPIAHPERAQLLRETQRVGQPIDSDIALIACTSGSTGTPKGALLSPANLTAAIEATHTRLGGDGRWLLATPADHIAGLMVLLRSLHAGFTPEVIDLTGGFCPGTLCSAITTMAGPRRYLSLVPLQLAKALTHPGATEALAELDAVLVGGQAIAPDLLARAREAGITAVTTYGSSETCGGVVYDGQPLPGVTVGLSAGRLTLTGAMVARGYRTGDHPDLAHGTFTTSDLGAIAADGQISVLGRADDMIISGGLKHLPRDVDAALTDLPSISAAATVGIADDHLGQAMVSLVELADGASITQARADLAAQIPDKHSRPRAIYPVSGLPTLPSGKIDRAAVRHIAAQQYNRKDA
ncbi:o-succinylbenzoate--CoA ligase [Corynebacterium sp. TAE3-ERU12]|uniref:o-succinylbenzoate--CoA ligase n=1 Tax=Corynebacterium sp. TAE3-ERU12 TaxID=2849491 RepID=UPI001C4654AA|nr:o-succinylbenzoate--CoA ligase [Corynebacterium sp. TAE3-ERU12]MBV7294564.1 o-succinylbenzoate--CoA ligase [Corynebacterium sp. TAE3-ERU12]